MSPEDPADRHLSAIKTPLQISRSPVLHGGQDDSQRADRSGRSPETPSSVLARAIDESHGSSDPNPNSGHSGWNFFHNTKSTLSDKDCPAKAQRSRSYEDQDEEDFEHGSWRKRARMVDRQENFDRVSGGHHDLQPLGGAQDAAPSATSHASPVGENRGKHSQSDLVLMQGNLTNAHADSHDDWSIISYSQDDAAEVNVSSHHRSGSSAQLYLLRAELAATKKKLERAQSNAASLGSLNLAGWTVQESIKPLTEPSYQAARDFCDQLKRFEDNGGRLDRIRLVNETVATHMEACFMAKGWLVPESHKDWVQWPVKQLWDRLRQIWPNTKTCANTPLSVLFANVRLSSYDVRNQDGFNDYAIRVLSIRYDALTDHADEKAAVDVLIRNVNATYSDGGNTVQPTLGAVAMARRVKMAPRPTTVDEFHRKICAINELARERVCRATEWLLFDDDAPGRVDVDGADMSQEALCEPLESQPQLHDHSDGSDFE
jgi:hypothetical protein